MAKPQPFLALLRLALFGALSYAAMAVGSTCDPSASNVTVGGALSISALGRYFSTGRNIYQSLLMFQDWVNNHYGGVRFGGENHCLQVLIRDDQSSLVNVQNITLDLLQSKSVDFLIAPYSSDLTKAAAVIADQFDTITLSPGSATASVFKGSRILFGSLTAADTSLFPILSRLFEDGAKTVGYFYEDQTYTDEVCGAIPDIITQFSLGLEIVRATKLPASPSEEDIAHELDQYTTEPDILVGCTYFEECITALNLMEARHFVPGAKIFTLCATDASFSSKAGSAGLYTLTGAQWDPSLPYIDEYTNWTAHHFATMYEDRWGEPPAYQGAAAFAIMEALLKAIEQADGLNTYEVAYYLSRNTVASFYGALEFDSLNMNNAVISYVQAFEDLETAVVLPRTAASHALAYPIDCVMLHGADSCECTLAGCTFCTKDDYVTDYDPCGPSMWRTVRVSLNPGSTCVEKSHETGSFTIACPYTPFTSPAGWAIICLVIITVLSSVAGIVWLLYHRREKIIIASQPTFLVLFCVGVALLGVCMLSVPGEVTVSTCTMRVWTGGIGFTVAFGSLTLKVFRVYRIFGNATLTRVRVREKDVLGGLAAMILFDVAVLTYLTTVEPPSVSVRTRYEHHGIIAAEDHNCMYSGRISITVFLASKAVLMLHGLYLSFKTRHVDSRFESSGKVMLAIYQYALAFVTFALVENIAVLTEWESNIVFCSAMTFAALSSMVLIILSKVFMLKDSAGLKDKLAGPAGLTGARASARLTTFQTTQSDTHTVNPMVTNQSPEAPAQLTHRQFMDIVFSPADIIDMNERIAFLESENSKLAKQLETLRAQSAPTNRQSSYDRRSTGRSSLFSSPFGTPHSFRSHQTPTPDPNMLSEL